MQESNANRNPGWDALLGDNTATGTVRLMAMVALFVVIGGTVFYLI